MGQLVRTMLEAECKLEFQGPGNVVESSGEVQTLRLSTGRCGTAKRPGAYPNHWPTSI